MLNMKIMAYRIYDNEADFLAKSDLICQSGVAGDCTQYADLATCKHPTEDLWAMPVMEYAQEFFEGEPTVETLTPDWQHTVNKPE